MKHPFIGEFDRRVRIRFKQDVPDGAFDLEPTYDAGVSVWARILPVGAALFYGTAQVETEVTHRMATWQTSRVNAEVITGDHRVDDGAMHYRVRRVVDIDGQRTFVLLDLEQLGVLP